MLGITGSETRPSIRVLFMTNWLSIWMLVLQASRSFARNDNAGDASKRELDQKREQQQWPHHRKFW